MVAGSIDTSANRVGTFGAPKESKGVKKLQMELKAW